MNHTYRLVWNDAAQRYVPAPETAKGRGKSSGRSAVVVALGAALLSGGAWAGPSGGTVSAGSGSIAQSGANTTITQSSQNLAINWASFNVAASESVNFVQPNASAIALNRVTGKQSSVIDGSLSANGQVWILNPNGVLFGSGASVNVGGLVASTLSLSDADFLAGKRSFTGDGSQGSVLNQGSLTGGYVALLGKQVSNQGSIITANGSAALAAGDSITLDFSGNQLLSVQVDAGTLNALAENKGLIRSDNGTVILTASAKDALLDTVVNNDGVIEARGIDASGGTIVLLGGMGNGNSGGTVTVGGTIDASATTGSGGTVHATASQVVVKNAAVIDASGAQGGGEVLIGGGWQGNDARVANASMTTAETGSTIKANAIDNGDGGTVVLWSDELTRVGGHIEAKGGINGGNGGKVETSGKMRLQFRATVDTSAAQGESGSLLLDPQDIIIVDGTGGADDGFLADGVVGASEPDTTSDVTISEQTLEGLSGNVTLQASRDVVFADLSDDLLNMSSVTAGSAFTVSAGRHIVQTADINDRVQTAGGDVNFSAANGQINIGGIYSRGGSVTLNAGGANGDVIVGDIITTPASGSGGAISLSSGASMMLGGAADIDARGTGLNAAGNVTLASGAAIVAQSGSTIYANDLQMSAVGGISNGAGAGAAVQAARLSAGNTGSGHIALAHTGANTLVVQDMGLGYGIQNTATSGDVSLATATGSLKVLGSTVSAAGGNILLSASGYSDAHSVEITNNGATRSSISTTGAGTITINGSLTSGGASATGGSAGGVVITDSDITTDTGAISITGHAGGVSTGSQIERGFRLDTGTNISSAGNISLTGTVSGNQSIPPYPYTGPSSMGGEVANGATVSSTGGNVTLSGTLNNASHFDGTGLAVNGKLQSGAGSKIAFSGAATVGTFLSGTLFTGSGTGLSTGMLSEIVAGTGGLDITGTVSSSSTSTNLIGASLNGAISSTGNIAVTGTSTSATAPGVTALYLTGGTLTGLGTATITLKGHGVLAVSSAFNHDVNVMGTTVSTAGGEISVTGNRMNIQSAINSGSGRTVITTYTASQLITLGGVSGIYLDELNLSSSELNQITASVLQLGTGVHSGGISIGNGGAVTMTTTPALSLVTTGSITQAGRLTVNSLNAIGSSVTLTNAANQISNISGIATSGSFQATSTSGLTVGTVDGVSGINSAGKVLLQTTSDLTLDSAITAGSTASDALVLVAGGKFINSVGAAALQIPGAARWQVWSTNPANDTRNNLDYDFKQYNASYGTTAVASTGNGFFYTLAPTITSALTGTISKTYDTGTAATLTAANFSAAAGAVDGDTVSLNTSTTGTYNNKNAGTGKTVAATGVSLASTTNGSKNVFGYTLGNVSGNIGTINQASLAVNGISAVDKVYDASTTAALTGTAAISVLGGDVVTLGGTGVGAFTDKNVGTNKAVAVSGYTLSGADAGNYAVVQPAGLAANITPKALGYSTAAIDKTYDGNTTAVATLSGLTGLIGSETVTVSSTGATFNSKDVASANLVSVNSITLADGANGGLASNYSIATGGTATASITAKALSYSTTAANKSYDGTTVATFSGAGLNGVVSGDAVALSQSGSFSDKNAGTGKTVSYVSSLSGSDAGNYVLASNSGTVTADIVAATLSVSGTTAANKTYDGTTAATVSGGTLSGLISGDSVALSQSGAFSDKNVAIGKTVAVANSLNGSDAGNYIVAAGSTTADITAATLTVSGTIAANKTYDGTTAAALSGGALSGLIGSDDVALSQSGSFSDKNVATGKTISYASSLSGSDAGNYMLASGSGTASADITAATLTVSGTTAANKTYDGTTSATLSGGALSGLIGSDSVTLGQSGTFSDKNAATGKTVSYASSLSGSDAGNYVLAASNGTTSADITAATLTVSGTTAANKTYDGTTAASLSGSLSGLFGSDSVMLTQSGSFSDKNAATGKTVSYASSLSGTDAGNYVLASSNGSTIADITAATLTASGTTAANKTYDGTTAVTVSGGSLSGLIGSDAVVLSQSGSFSDRNAGTGKAVTIANSLSGSDAGNYVVAASSTTADITAATLMVNGSTAANKTYDGTTAAMVSGGALSGVVSGDTVTLGQSGTFSDKNAGTGKTVTIANSLSGSDAGNYLVAAGSTIADITPAALTVTANDDSRITNGSAYSGGNGVRYSGFVNGETSSVLGGSLVYGGTAQGASTAGSYSISADGLSADNYSLAYVDGSLSIRAGSTPAQQELQAQHVQQDQQTDSPDAEPLSAEQVPVYEQTTMASIEACGIRLAPGHICN